MREQLKRVPSSRLDIDSTAIRESIDNACHMVEAEGSAFVERAQKLAGDIETTLNALTLRSLSHFPRADDKDEGSRVNLKWRGRSFESIKKKLKLKTKKIERKEIISAKQKCEASINSFTVRVNQLVSKKIHKEILEAQLNLRVILIDEEITCHEIVNMSLKFNEEISVQELIDIIPQHAKNPTLAKQYYDGICLENAFVLDKLEPIQKYLLPSNEKQIVIAVPSVDACSELVELAKPIIYNARTITSCSVSAGDTKLLSMISAHIPNNTLLLSNHEVESVSDRSLPLLLRATENDSSKSITNTPSTPIDVTDVIYMICALMFIFVTHNSSQ